MDQHLGQELKAEMTEEEKKFQEVLEKRKQLNSMRDQMNEEINRQAKILEIDEQAGLSTSRR